jgi:3-hydroxyisobutyrate dehydrogenase-like beta-hydroxyacid dehydrogenase
MSAAPAIGFVGFGEAAFHIAKGLRAAGAGPIHAFDIASTEIIQRRAHETATQLVASNEELAAACNVIFATVTSDQAPAAACETAPFLSARHYYADLNSVSPALKQSIGATIAKTGAHFVEIAVMAPVPPYGHRVPMLLGGESAGELMQMLAPYGMRMEIAATEIGVAAATKMFRSIVVKGLEALVTECVLGASRYGAAERVFASLAESYPGLDWPKLADYMVGRVVVHGERRAREMEEVSDTLRALGIEPIMSEATARRMDWSAKLGLKARFGGEAPRTYREVIDVVDEIARKSDASE